MCFITHVSEQNSLRNVCTTSSCYRFGWFYSYIQIVLCINVYRKLFVRSYYNLVPGIGIFNTAFCNGGSKTSQA